MRKRSIFNIIMLVITTVVSVATVRNLQKSLTLRLTNQTGEALNCWIGTDEYPEMLELKDFQFNETRRIDLKEIPIGPHAAIYITFLRNDGDSFRRTLIYDVDEYQGPIEALVVDYGYNSYDVKVISYE